MNDVLVAECQPPSLCKPGRSATPARTLPAEIEFRPSAISGELFLTRFALPCGWGEFQVEKINESQWMHLLAIALGKLEPEHIIRGFLSGLFPRLVGGLYEYRGPDKINNAWSYQNVLEYLLEHKGHADECAARCVAIRQSAGVRKSPITGDLREMFWPFRLGSPFSLPIFDLYQINPKPDSIVLAHKSVIITQITPELVDN